MKLEELRALQNMLSRMKNNVSRMNSAYDYYGMDNTIESVYPDECTVMLAMCNYARQNTELRLELCKIDEAVTRLEAAVREKRRGH
jgi:lipid II:glycine glycyltransferase (peptidoglycan interpeptide bridge formation enzyme)